LPVGPTRPPGSPASCPSSASAPPSWAPRGAVSELSYTRGYAEGHGGFSRRRRWRASPVSSYLWPMQIGIDLGGTKIEGIALDADTLVAVRRRVATPRDYAGTLDAITRIVAE